MMSVRLTILFLTSNSLLCMQMPYRRIYLPKPEFRSAQKIAVSSLREHIILYLVAKHGSHYLHEVCTKIPTATTKPLLDWWDTYIRKCREEIEADSEIKETIRSLPYVQKNHPLPAQPLDAFINLAYEKKRFDLITVIGERYYTERSEWPALCLLSAAGYLKSCQRLCSGYVEINCRDHHRKTPLMEAAQKGKKEVVAFLLTQDDVDLSCKTICEKDALKLAQENNQSEIVTMLKNALQHKKTKKDES